MIAELKPSSQITIPKPLIDKFGLAAGDKLEIFENNGMICIMPVVVYPQNYINEMLNHVETIKREVTNGQRTVYTNVDDLIASLESDDQ